VCAFQFKQEAVQFYQEVGERLGKFGLELAQEKTNIISFSRFRKEEKTKFEFLGFEFSWGITLGGKDHQTTNSTGKVKKVTKSI